MPGVGNIVTLSVPGSPGQATSEALLSDGEGVPPTLDVGEIESLIEQRNEARRMCNFKAADNIREYLRMHGVGLMDEPGGRGEARQVTTWRYWKHG